MWIGAHHPTQHTHEAGLCVADAPRFLLADLGGRHGAVAGEVQRENLRDQRREEGGGKGAGGPHGHCEDLVLGRGQIRAEWVRQGGREDRHLERRVNR